jgi:hypothetical protein
MDTREALEKSIVLWDWLAENPGKGKGDGLAACFPLEPLPLYACFLCESVKYTLTPLGSDVPDCKLCPVWPTTDEDDRGCEAEGSPYQAWVNHHRNDTAARAVANLCRKALENLK